MKKSQRKEAWLEEQLTKIPCVKMECLKNMRQEVEVEVEVEVVVTGLTFSQQDLRLALDLDCEMVVAEGKEYWISNCLMN